MVADHLQNIKELRASETVGAESAMNVEVKNLSFAYKNSSKNVLNNAFMSVEGGECIVILGASGCGKTTLLKIIAGLLTNSSGSSMSGSVSIDNRDVIKDPGIYKRFRKSGVIGYMSQQAVLFDHMTVRENIALPMKIIAANQKKKRHDLYDRVDQLLELVDLKNDHEKYPSQLSGGMKTRVALARLFSTRMGLLLLDEPFGAIDIALKSKLYENFHNLRKEFNTTTVLVTHDIFEAILFSKNLCVMDLKGRASRYEVDGWTECKSYEEVIEMHKDSFEDISEIIKNEK